MTSWKPIEILIDDCSNEDCWVVTVRVPGKPIKRMKMHSPSKYVEELLNPTSVMVYSCEEGEAVKE